MIDRGSFEEVFMWNASMCACELDKLCNAGEYLDGVNCTCSKRLIYELVTSWNEDEIIKNPAMNSAVIINGKEYEISEGCLVDITLLIISCLYIIAITCCICLFSHHFIKYSLYVNTTSYRVNGYYISQ